MDNLEDIIKDVKESEIVEMDIVEAEQDEDVVEEVSTFTVEEVTQFAETVNVDVGLFTETYSTMDELVAVVAKERQRKVSEQNSTQAPQTDAIKETEDEVDVVAQEASFNESLSAINTKFGG